MYFRNDIEKSDTLEVVNSEFLNWDYFKNSTVLVTGATGLIGTQIIKAFLYADEIFNLNIKIQAIVRNIEKAKKIYKSVKIKNLEFIVQDIIQPIMCQKTDYIIHCANSTASKDFVETPVETIDTILVGTKNILEYAKNCGSKSIVYLSSMEVYGNIQTDRIKPLKEKDLGYLDTMKARNSYPMSKRMAETMCYSYFSEFNLPVKIARLSQTIGANIDYNDNRVFIQFARNIKEKKDIILHTLGQTVRSYCYVTDAVVGIISMLKSGKSGEAYNITNAQTVCSIRDMAEMLSNKYPHSKLEIQIDERLYPDTTKYYLDTKWEAQINLEEMYARLIRRLENIEDIYK